MGWFGRAAPLVGPGLVCRHPAYRLTRKQPFWLSCGVPSPLEHVSIALGVVAALSMDHAGAFFAGAIAPDVDKLLGRPRATTHWWLPGSDLSGALRLCAARPSLMHWPTQSTAQAFVAGYLCHLVTDEQWTLRIYRPHFGKYSPFQGGPDGADHQLALQGMLDTTLVNSGVLRPAVSELTKFGDVEALARCVLGMTSDDATALDRFVRSVLRRAEEPSPVERLRMMGEARDAERALVLEPNSPHPGRPLHPRTTDSQEALDAFVARLPALDAAVSQLVVPEAVETFRDHAISASRKLVREFLAGLALTPPPGTAEAPYFASPARTDL